MKKQRGAAILAVPVVLFALLVSLVSAPIAPSATCSTGSGNETVKMDMAGCHGCGQTMVCCASKNKDARQPATAARTSSDQQFLAGLHPSGTPLLYVFPVPKPRIQFSSGDFPHYSSTPLAQSCIQLI